MRFAGNNINRTGATDGLSGGVELGERSKRGIGTGVAVGIEDIGQMYSCSSHICHGRVEIAKVVLNRESPAGDVAVAEIVGHCRQGRQLRLMAWNLGGDGILVALEIHYSVGLGVGALPVGKDEVAGDVVSRWQGYH